MWVCDVCGEKEVVSVVMMFCQKVWIWQSRLEEQCSAELNCRQMSMGVPDGESLGQWPVLTKISVGPGLIVQDPPNDKPRNLGKIDGK